MPHMRLLPIADVRLWLPILYQRRVGIEIRRHGVGRFGHGKRWRRMRWSRRWGERVVPGEAFEFLADELCRHQVSQDMSESRAFAYLAEVDHVLPRYRISKQDNRSIPRPFHIPYAQLGILAIRIHAQQRLEEPRCLTVLIERDPAVLGKVGCVDIQGSGKCVGIAGRFRWTDIEAVRGLDRVPPA